MGLDSVEIIVCWEESLGISISDELASGMMTPNDSINCLMGRVRVRDGKAPCLAQQAFHRIRNILVNEFAVSRGRIRPGSKFSQLFPKKGQRQSWKRFGEALNVERLSATLGWPLFGPGGTTIQDVVIETVARGAIALNDPGGVWTRSQLREIVRSSVTFVTGVKDFSDDDHYVKEIGID